MSNIDYTNHQHSFVSEASSPEIELFTTMQGQKLTLLPHGIRFSIGSLCDSKIHRSFSMTRCSSAHSKSSAQPSRSHRSLGGVPAAVVGRIATRETDASIRSSMPTDVHEASS